jgi:hypothetical protein
MRWSSTARPAAAGAGSDAHNVTDISFLALGARS